MANDGYVLRSLRGVGIPISFILLLSLCDADGVWMIGIMMNMVTG